MGTAGQRRRRRHDRLWDVADPAHPRPLGQPLTSGGTVAVDSVAFSPDGHTLAGGSADGTVVLWDVGDPAHPSALGQPLTSSGTAAVDSVAFSPDGRTLASGSADGTVVLWDVGDPAHPSALGQPLTSSGSAAVDSVAFSPDGHTLASGSARRHGRAVGYRRSRAPQRARPAPDQRRYRRRRFGGVQPVMGTRWPAAASTAPSGCGASLKPS